MMMLPTVPSYTDMHNRWIQYHEEQVDILSHCFRSWCHSLDRATWSFFHNQIDQIENAAQKNTTSLKTFIHSNRI
jgi:hypothetical protein